MNVFLPELLFLQFGLFNRKIVLVPSNTLALYPVSMRQTLSWALGTNRLVPPIKHSSIPYPWAFCHHVQAHYKEGNYYIFLTLSLF